MIQILGDGVLKLIEEKVRANETQLNIILEDIKELLEYIFKITSRIDIKIEEKTLLHHISVDEGISFNKSENENYCPEFGLIGKAKLDQ